MKIHRRLLIVLCCCLLPLWLSGPYGRLLVVLPLLLFGPGYLLERALTAQSPLPVFVRPALWLGLSIGCVALLYQWASLLGVALGIEVLHAIMLLLLLGVVYRLWHEDSPVALLFPLVPGRHLSRFGAWYALGAVLALTLWTRFSQIEGQALPLWVDSVHHALLVRIAAESGMAPTSLAPYLPVENLPYHWGYHVVTAALLQLSGLPLPTLMLWSGQILNALHVLTVAALAVLFWRRPLAGVAAGIVVGLLSLMPAYYVSWGRYTQLTGLLMLPALAASWHMALRVGTRSWFALASLLLAGLVLVHLRVLIFALCLLAIMSLVWAIRQPWAVIRQRAVVAMVSAAVAVVLSLPWLWTAAVRVLLPAVEQPQTLVSRSSYNRLNTGLLWAGHNRLLVAVALTSSFVLLWRRRVGVTMLVGWVALLVTLANPWLMSYLLPMCGALLLLAAIGNRRLWQGFSGALLLLLNPLLVTFPAIWLLNTEAVIISLFVPLGVLIGGGTALLWAWLCHIRWPRWRVLAQGTCMLALCALALWGTWNSRQVINPVTMLATDADLEAIEWVDSHTSEDARFLINAAGWLPLADRGTDGGWWLLPLTGRWISTPPVLYTYGAPDYVQQVQRQSRLVSGYEPGQEAQIKQLIAEAGITHIYLGAESEPLTREIFSADPNIEVIYEQNGITILAVKRQS